MKNQGRTSCIQCGTCCRKGGPALHTHDAQLVKSGKIPCKFLFTIREGEPAFDNVRDRTVTARSDIIKIKNKNHSPSCMFLDEQKDGCEIYDFRPIECKALQCWNTERIEQLYDRDRLTRKELLSETDDLWDLIIDHQERCDYDRIRTLLEDGNKNENKREEIRFLVRYDAHLRSLLSEKGGMDPDMMDFLLGKPLGMTVRRFGIVLDDG